MFSFVVWLAILTLARLPLIASSKIVYRWVLTGVPMPKIEKYSRHRSSGKLADSPGIRRRDGKNSSPKPASKAWAATWSCLREMK
jgi:hypothetical protein